MSSRCGVSSLSLSVEIVLESHQHFTDWISRHKQWNSLRCKASRSKIRALFTVPEFRKLYATDYVHGSKVWSDEKTLWHKVRFTVKLIFNLKVKGSIFYSCLVRCEVCLALYSGKFAGYMEHIPPDPNMICEHSWMFERSTRTLVCMQSVI